MTTQVDQNREDACPDCGKELGINNLTKKLGCPYCGWGSPSSRPMTPPQSHNTGAIPDQTINRGAVTLRQQLDDQIWKALTENVDEPGLIGPSGEKQHANVKRLCQEIDREARQPGYDADLLGSWVFIGDKAKLDNLDDLYWSYVMEQIARDSASYDHYKLEYCKNNMKYAGFDKVGFLKMLAIADQYAKKRVAELTQKPPQEK